MPVFPDEKISTGYTWTQKTPVDLPSGDTTTASMTYKIKGTTQKMGYNCAIIEYNGTVVLPLFRDPQDTTAFEMVDWIEMSGILYYGIDIGTFGQFRGAPPGQIPSAPSSRAESRSLAAPESESVNELQSGQS